MVTLSHVISNALGGPFTGALGQNHLPPHLQTVTVGSGGGGGGGGSGGGVGHWQTSEYIMDPRTMTFTPKTMLKMRLHIHPHDDMPFDFCEVAKKPDGDYAVFLVVNNQAIVIEDGGPLFPSDTLIGKLNTLRK